MNYEHLIFLSQFVILDSRDDDLKSTEFNTVIFYSVGWDPFIKVTGDSFAIS